MTTITDASFLLGNAYSLLTTVREHLIRRDDLAGIELIEDQYQRLERGIYELYYSNMEKKDGSGK
jgi:hypothetical protein